jgi:preprotein translocase subunit SecA
MSSAVLRIGVPQGAYAEREEPPENWLDETASRGVGVLLRHLPSFGNEAERLVALAGGHEASLKELSPHELKGAAVELRRELRAQGLRLPVVARAFALVREAARRTRGQRHYDVQMVGGWTMLQGRVAEMATGEGKTLAATLPAATVALAGLPVHIVTVNDYLVGRDAASMGPVFRALGLSVGAIQHDMSPAERREAYACDVTYCSNKELAFDYLKDRITLGRVRSRSRLQLEALRDGSSRVDRLLLRGLCFAIVDEADSVLIDEARTPLIISGGGRRHLMEREVYAKALELAESLESSVHYTINPRERTARLTPAGQAHVATITQGLGEIWAGQQRARELVQQALTARYLFRRDQHYLVHDGKVQIVDEYTGRRMGDRSWEHGLHQMIEVKEGCDLTHQVEPLARISYQRFFRRFKRLAGMTGTAREVSGELWAVYGLRVVSIPTHRPMQRASLGERVVETPEERWTLVVDRIRELHHRGQPVLVGTRSVEASETLSGMLTAEGLPHRVLNARQDAEEAAIVAQAGLPGRITVATNMAGRGTDIVPAPESLEVGGLHVIATEFHEARRIDRQLLGRAGRQGDPGTTEIIASLGDELARTQLPRSWTGLPARSGGERLRGRVGWLLMRMAQRRAEAAHSRARRALLKTDERIEAMLAFAGKGE